MGEPLPLQYQEPYKPHDIIKLVEPPQNIEIPRTDDQIVEVAKYIVAQKSKSPNLLPPEYKDFENFLNQTYKANYKEGKWTDVSPRKLDYVYQQYGIRMDDKYQRNAFNTFGLYAVSYLDGLHTMGVQKGYLGSGGWEHVTKDPDEYCGLLLGSSSITTANEFFRFMNGVNPKAKAIVTDIDPLAVKLSKEGIYKRGQSVIQSDAQKIPLENRSCDFIATNFLVLNLIDTQNSGIETLPAVMKEISRVLTSDGRLVMVEQLDRIDLEWLNHYAYEEGLLLCSNSGINESATILDTHSKVKDLTGRLPEFIDESRRSDAHEPVFDFTTKPKSYFGGERQSSVTNLVFRYDKDRR